MLNSFFKFIFSLTSVSPILITFFFINLINEWKSREVASYGDATSLFLNNYIFLIIPLILLLISFVIIKMASKKLESFNLCAKSVGISEKGSFAFLLAYLMPLLTRQDTRINMEMIYLFFAVFFFSILFSQSYHYNPLLGIFGYQCYEVRDVTGMNYVLLTRRNIKSCLEVNRVVHITDYMIVESS